MDQETPPSQEELKKLAVEYAKAILSGDLAPYAGARRIWWEVANWAMNDDEIWGLKRGFVNDADDWRITRTCGARNSRRAYESTHAGSSSVGMRRAKEAIDEEHPRLALACRHSLLTAIPE
jgi:hypothetical protein